MYKSKNKLYVQLSYVQHGKFPLALVSVIIFRETVKQSLFTYQFRTRVKDLIVSVVVEQYWHELC